MAGVSETFSVDVRELDGFLLQMRECTPRVKEELDKATLEAAELVTETARTNASKHSTTIPGSIHMVPTEGGALIQAGGPEAPLASLYELGNKGAGGGKLKDGRHLAFRHPVFGHNVWVYQQRYKFLSPAIFATRKPVKEIQQRALDEALAPMKLTAAGAE